MRILLAEDDHALSQVLVKILEKNNYTVDAVFNGADALEYLRNGSYTAVILDLTMPIMDGYTVLKKLRAESINIPVIVLSVITDVKEKVNVLDLGANDFLSKPFDTDELLARIRAITRGSASHDSTLSFGNTVLNRASFELSSDTKSIRLTNKEFQILELLMLSPHTVYSSEKLMAHVWNYDSNTDISVIWVYISNLRKKLANLESNITIKSSRHSGYYLEEV